MAKHRDHLPQLDGGMFLTDGGLETTLIFQDGFDLPNFAAFELLQNDAGLEALRKYTLSHASIAHDNGVGFILETATWRSSPDWGALMGYTPDGLADVNKKAVAGLVALRSGLETDKSAMVISGCVGPRGDGYVPGEIMTPAVAQAYHAVQIGTFAETEADMITGLTITNAPEAIGLTNAAKVAGMPVVISFTVETDGKLPTGQSMKDAVAEVDAATGNGPAYYMINCAHPTHYAQSLEGGAWAKRVKGMRANASRMSHAELDVAEELDDGDPVELGAEYAELRALYPWINVLGGCCGTDHRHTAAVYAANAKG
ncbi:MAG: homocysteine S-methyltransferase family protein [Chloroflexi bacterium]|nr:homocysteine S-methyltransferase family protein [Chloroflexota bacterium]MDA1174436.1 homocysteine S-methyltransferase family protein [Chloroflexota bacterium]